MPDGDREDWYRSASGKRELPVGAGYQDFSSSYIMYIGHDVVHPAVGLSATINQAMLTCSLRNIIPVSDSSAIVALMSHKYQKAKSARAASLKSGGGKRRHASRKSKQSEWDIRSTVLPEYDAGTAQLAFAAVTSIISPQDLSRRSFDDLIRFSHGGSA